MRLCRRRRRGIPQYVFDNQAAETEQRFSALEEIYDSLSIRHLKEQSSAPISFLTAEFTEPPRFVIETSPTVEYERLS